MKATRTTRSPPVPISPSTTRSRSGAIVSTSTSARRHSRRLPEQENVMLVARVVSLSAAVLALAQGAQAQGAPAATKFTIKVENISKGEVLKLSNGRTAPFVSAPVLWAVQTGSANPIFVAGQADAGKGLETLAETGNPAPLAKSLNGAARVVTVGADDRPVGSDAGGPIPP